MFAGAATTNRLQHHQRFFPVSVLPCRLGGDPNQSERPATPAGVDEWGGIGIPGMSAFGLNPRLMAVIPPGYETLNPRTNGCC
jgi:hypothetical protein